MERMSKHYINSLVTGGYAMEVDDKACEELLKHGYTKVGYASGVYGISAGVVVDDVTGIEYVIPQRNSMLFKLF